MIDHELVEGLSERHVVALTLYGEARGEAIEGRIAVANVIRNRAAARRPAFGLTPRDVCLKAWQFSCWLPQGGADNYAAVLDAARALTRDGGSIPPMLGECLWIADGLLGARFGDTVKGATHYVTADLHAQRKPAWAVGLEPVLTLHAHLFFAGVR